MQQARQAQQAIALNNDWLNATPTVATNYLDSTSGEVVNGSTTTFGCTADWWTYPWYTYPVYVSGPARPIKLKMSEVEFLRTKAQKDAKLRKILAKFTDQIEVTVDFDKA